MNKPKKIPTNKELLKMLEKEQETMCKAIAAADPENKYFGQCDSCKSKTVLSTATDMCGVCTFGEAETINGNW